MSDDTQIYNNGELEGRSTVDGSVVRIEVDPYSGSLQTIETEHARIHAGDGFQVSGKISTIGTGASEYFLVVPSIVMHWRHFRIVTTEAPIDIVLYENPTVTANGTSLTIQNRNRLSTHTAGATVYGGSTVTADGTAIFTDMIPTSAKDSGGDVEGLPVEWIINGGNTYALKITNNSGGNIDIIYQFFWYELDL